MLEAMAEWMGFPMYFAFNGAPPPPRNGAGHATIYPYGPFETVDGIVFLGLQNDREWILFAEAVLRRPDLAADPRFKGNAGRADHRDLLEPILVGILSSLSTGEAIARLEHAGIATAHVNDMAALWSHPQLAARDRWRQVGSPVGPLPALKPVTGDGWEPRLDPVPRLGEHTDAILAEFGFVRVFEATKGT
jgi:itaconate CoA-transferase